MIWEERGQEGLQKSGSIENTAILLQDKHVIFCLFIIYLS